MIVIAVSFYLGVVFCSKYNSSVLKFCTGAGNTTSYEDLLKLSSELIEKTQTGAVAASSGLDIVALSVKDPDPVPVDPTGGVRATNLTGK